jgi:ParB family transcriptional regulator, chromosome partitioning protein
MSVKKRALGRGLDAVFGAASPAPTAIAVPAHSETSSSIRMMAVGLLAANPYQPRQHFHSEKLEELAASIAEKGILQPLIIRRNGPSFQIVAGERRWRAAQRAGLTEVPVIVRDYSDQDMLELALIENLQRDDLNAIEEATAYRQLIEEFELTQEQVAERVGKSRVAVTNSLRLLRLPSLVIQWIDEDRLSAGHAKAMLALETEPAIIALAREVMSGNMSVRETERRVRRLIKGPDPKVPITGPQVDIQTSEMEEKLRLHLGLQIKILPRSNVSGKIEVHYSTLDEFQRLFEQLGISLEKEL